jgi:hypothetical protein
VVKDPEIGKETYIGYSFIALDKNNETNLSDAYEHRNLGGTYIIHQEGGQFQIFTENKSCMRLRYCIIDNLINEDNTPEALMDK